MCEALHTGLSKVEGLSWRIGQASYLSKHVVQLLDECKRASSQEDAFV